jgi:hypothetical protein
VPDRKDLESIGILPLTGEACAFSLRILCDLNEKGVGLVERAFGLYIDREASPRNMNSIVGSVPAVRSMMFTWDQLTDIWVYALAERHALKGDVLVVAEPKPEHDFLNSVIWAGNQDEYRWEWFGEKRNEEGEYEKHPDGDEFRLKNYDWRTYYVYEEQPHVGGRNVHAMSGRSQ